MKLILFADGFVGSKISSHLINNYCQDLSLIVCTSKNEIYEYGNRKKIPVCEYSEIDKLSHEDKFDLGILAWWPKIIKEPLLSLPKQGFINTHPSLLPYNRGKHYNFWTLVEQTPFGVSLHFIDEGIDTGDIIFQKTLLYDWTDTGETLYNRAQNEMIKLFIDSYDRIRIGNYERIPQNNNIGSYHHSSELNNICNIDLNATYPIREILNLLRARTFEGHPGCIFEENGSKYEITLKIKKVN